ncbi:hypothetical protein KIH74_15095 [Kineosporia sp. J2-2]|uniref:Uncharacterized protein n=1 Tax=Kineosporia corallincola TaxID=2835133 RepID=A0ABS5TGP1_9ACTN|nr:hypothetical protein [Kineosporia corallincola]MBT0770266.1 hypothetical protein [Kineosporia corallincola]
MNDAVQAVGALADQIDRSRERVSAAQAVVEQGRLQAQGIGARVVAEDLAGLGARLRAVDQMLAQAALGVGQVRRGAEAVRGSGAQTGPVRVSATLKPAGSGKILEHLLTHPAGREKRWRAALSVMAGGVPATFLARAVHPLPVWVTPVAGAGVAAVGGVYGLHRQRVRRVRLAWRLGARPQWSPEQEVTPQARTLVLRALGHVLRDFEPGWLQVVEDLQSTEGDVFAQAMDFVLAIDAMALYALCGDRRPVPGQNYTLAADYVRAHPQAGVSPSAVNRVLAAIADERSTGELPPKRTLLVPALCFGAFVLGETARYGDMTWAELLDEIEVALAVQA